MSKKWFLITYTKLLAINSKTII